jgi:hypothetical protein
MVGGMVRGLDLSPVPGGAVRACGDTGEGKSGRLATGRMV